MADRRFGYSAKIPLVVLGAGALLLAGFWAVPWFSGVGRPSNPSPAVTLPAQAASPSAPIDVYAGNPIVAIVKKASPAVVNIDTETMVRQNPFPFPDDPIFREFFGEEYQRYSRIVPMRGKGSGFIVSKDGTILTNNHVVQGADKIIVTLNDGRHFPAKRIGADPTFDLAVIRIEGKDLPVLPLGDSDKIQVGEWVVAIGNPFGLENTVTVGVVSAKNRTIQAQDVNFQGFMQTDAAINPGNSGGPLIGMTGEVVGINSAIVPFAQGIGFAVPVNMAKQIMDDLIRHGSVKRGWLGVAVQPLTPAFAEAYGVPEKEGAVVGDVVSGSPADRAGLRRGDVILSIGGAKVKSSQDVVLLIRNRLAGDKVVVEFFRGGRREKAEVTLGNIPETQAGRPRGEGRGAEEPRTAERLGILVSDPTPDLLRKFRIRTGEGVIVVDLKPGKGATLGLQPGDVILEINRRRIRSTGDFESALSGDPKALVMLVRRGSQTLFLSLEAE